MPQAVKKVAPLAFRDVVAIACYRAKRGSQIAARLEKCIDADVDAGHSPRALAVADKMFVCSRSENLWTASDLHSVATGDLFDGTGGLWNCNERLCPTCLAERSRRARATVRKAIQRPALKVDRWRFITLTMPTLPAAQSPLLNTIKVVARAWRLMSKRDWWKETIRAGVKGVEFTLGNPKRLANEGREWSPEIDGYHVHVHLLVLSGWVEWRRLRQEWSACLMESWAEFGLTDQRINTKDGLAVCDVRLVTAKKKSGHGMISGEGAIQEVAKYLTKCESWDKIPANQLVEVASIERWPRMFELLGECRNPRVARPCAAPAPIAECGEQVQTNDSVTVSFEDRLDALREDAIGGHVAGALELWQQVGHEKYFFGEISEETHAAVKHSTAYLDTPNVSGGNRPRAGPLIEPPKRAKFIREVGAEMIALGNREIWKTVLAIFARGRREVRRAHLATSYQFAQFRDLAGGSWSIADYERNF